MFGLSPQSDGCQIGGLAADGVGCEIRLALTHGRRLCWCEVAVGERGVQRSPPWELAPVLRRNGFTYVSVSPARLQTVFLPAPRGKNVKCNIFFSLLKETKQSAHSTVCFLCSISPSGLNCVPEVYI